MTGVPTGAGSGVPGEGTSAAGPVDVRPMSSERREEGFHVGGGGLRAGIPPGGGKSELRIAFAASWADIPWSTKTDAALLGQTVAQSWATYSGVPGAAVIRPAIYGGGSGGVSGSGMPLACGATAGSGVGSTAAVDCAGGGGLSSGGSHCE